MDSDRNDVKKDILKDKNIVFNKNDLNNYLFQKTEKLTTAIYRITEYISDKEPLKWILRKKALANLLLILSFTKKENRQIVFYKDVISSLKDIDALLAVTFNGSLVSRMNFSIVKNEYAALIDIVHKLRAEGVPHIDLLVLPQKEEINALIPDLSGRKFEEINKEISKKPVVKRKFLGITQDSKVSSDEHKEKRREAILAFIREHGEANIKDILSVSYLSQNFSEKTIQRELIALVEGNVLKKKGERRWSRYYL